LPYDPKFDPHRSRSGDKELAECIRKGIELAKNQKAFGSHTPDRETDPRAETCPTCKSRLYPNELCSCRMAEISQVLKCQCGETWQSKAGWDAQGLFEDLPNGNMMLHNLTEPCVEDTYCDDWDPK
jgi:ribosomal protein L32